MSRFSGIRWTGLSTAITTALQFAQLAALARLVDDRAMGLWAITQVAVGLAQTLADGGLGGAVVQRAEVTPEQRSSLFWFGVGTGAAAAVALAASAPAFAWAYGEPDLLGLVPVAAALFAVPAFGQLAQWMLQRELRFDAIARAEIFAASVATGVTIGAAWEGLGAYAPVLGQLAAAGVRVVAFWAAADRAWGPSLHFRQSDLDGFLRFGAFQVGERIVNYANTNADRVVLGLALGADLLGQYNLAYNLVALPVSRVSMTVTAVAFPVLARATDPRSMADGYLDVLRMVSFLTAPMLFGIAAVAHRFVPLALGPEWSGAVIFVQVLAMVTLLRSTISPMGALVLARGRPELGLYWNLGIGVVHPIGVILATTYGGARGLIAALLGLQIVYCALASRVVVAKLVDVATAAYLASFGRSILAAAGMAAVTLAVDRAVASPPVALAVGIGTGVVAYAGIAWLGLDAEVRTLRAALASRSA